jgi:hypothetical protein
VVREGEEVPKKGWFSGRKSQAPNGPASTSYPPSVTSVGETQKSERQSTEDGDLPPREVNAPEASTSALPTPGTGHQSGDVADDVPSDLPSHAGFDLAAMRAAIDDIQGGVQNQRDAGRVARLEFAPSLPQQGTAAAPKPRSVPPSGSGSQELPSARTLSVGDMREADPFGSEDAHEEDYDEDEDASRTPSPPTVSPHSRDATGPTLSFKGQGDEASWAPEVPDKDMFGDFGAAPIGNPFRSTPFAAVGPTVPPSSNTSSGTGISNASLGTERDPWSFQTFPVDVSANNTGVKKSSSMFAVNPWER